MADMTTIKGRIKETIYPNGTGAITAESHQALLLEMVDDINEKKQDAEKGKGLVSDAERMAWNNKADKTGRYPDLSVGFADDLVGRGESVPAEFSFRASGGKSIKDGTAWIKRLKGNSVVWNQLITNSSEVVTSNKVRAFNNGTSIVAGHKYLLLAKFNGAEKAAEISLYTRVDGTNVPIVNLSNLNEQPYLFFTSAYSVVSDGTANTNEGNVWQYFYFMGTSESITDTRLIDLTKAFPNDWQNINTIEEFNARKPIVEDEYAYNEGEVIHMTAEGIKSVGDNAWDEEWKRGYYMGKNHISEVTNQICSANPIPCLPNETYCVSVTGKTSFPHTIKFTFLDAQGDSIGETKITNTDQKITTPINATSFLVSFGIDYGDTYNNDIMITLVHSGWKQDTDAGYQPYWEDRLIFDQRIKDEFPNGMKSAGTAHDEIRFNKASGKWEAVQRIGSVDMGSMEWSYFEDYGFYATAPNNMVVGNLNYLTNQSYSKYANPDRISWTNSDKAITNGLSTIGTSWVRNICVKDSAYTDAATFKAAMAGVLLYYQLAEPTIIEYDEPFNLDYQVADFGTEQAITEQPSAAFSADIIYQFNAVDMIREHEIEINELQAIIATMQAQLASLTNKE